MKKNYSILNAGPFEKLQEKEYHGFSGKLFVGKDLGLTGCEVSLNRLPAGTSMPFAHAHKKNEELYLVLRGSGVFFVDGEEFPVQEGSLVRIAPAGERSWKASDQEDLYFICIQAQEHSLTQATKDDGIRLETKPSWMH